MCVRAGRGGAEEVSENKAGGGGGIFCWRLFDYVLHHRLRRPVVLCARHVFRCTQSSLQAVHDNTHHIVHGRMDPEDRSSASLHTQAVGGGGVDAL